MISQEHECIFIHQRKCAGTSIIRSFGIETPDNPRWHFCNDGVLSADYYSKPNYFLFSVVRNPWDRLISGWLYFDSARRMSLRELLHNLPQFHAEYRHITRLQRDILFDNSGHLVVDSLMRFENLQEDFDRVCRLIGKTPTRLSRSNASPVPRLHYREYFEDPIDQRLFLRHFQRDVDAFEYVF